MVVATNGACARELDQLRALATKTINEHVNDQDLCAICGSAWPCDRAVLAAHNLALTSGL